MNGESWIDVLPGHEVLAILKVREGPGARVVLRTRYGQEEAVTRIVGTTVPIPRQYGPIVRALAVHGRGAAAGLPEDAILVLEGYRSAARIRHVPGIPEVLDAGVLSVDPGDPRAACLPGGAGRLFVTTRWMEGQALDEAWPRLAEAEQDAALRAVLDRLREVHAARVVYADLKPGNVVLGPDGGVSLIDLDTIREVADDHAPAATVDLTRHYAAPEQQRDRVSFLPSDLYAFGVMAARLLGGVPRDDPSVPRIVRAPWDRVIAACLRARPFDRPRPETLLAALRDPATPLDAWDGTPAAGGDDTDRVPEPDGGATERVAEPPDEPPTEETGTQTAGGGGPTGSAPRPRRCRWISGLLLAVPILALAGLAGRVGWAIWERRAAETEASAALADLRAFKTDPVKNRDIRALEDIVARAGAARERSDTPRTRGAHALAWIWSTQWHHKSGSRTFTAARQAEGEAITALGSGPTSEGLFARGMYEGAICIHRPSADAERQRACDAAIRKLEAALAQLHPGPERDWIRLEVLWAAEMVERKIASRIWEAGDRAGARAEGRRILERCTAAESLLAAAPVNGVELVEDCVRVAALSGDVAAYLRWADRRIAWDARSGVRSSPAVVAWLTRSAHPDCAEVPVQRNTGVVWVPADATLESPVLFCGYAGLLALGCREDAERLRAEHDPVVWPFARTLSEMMGLTETPVEPPWKAAFEASRNPPRTSCLLR
ncbi:MAG: hypothetical protein JXB39_02620 [Deltaproteobacteria bacterium]|nr:hypothetical protein [Deltaproteobacteria bacterium]